MTPEAAAWVLQHVLVDYHDANEAHWWCGPDQDENRLRRCACQHGEDGCHWCRSGSHDQCRRFQAAEAQRAAQLRPAVGPDGKPTRPWRPIGWGRETTLQAPARWRPNDPKRPLYVAVWLADRVCRYLCACTVCGQTAAPEPVLVTPAPVPAVALAVPAAVEQLDLFEAVTV